MVLVSERKTATSDFRQAAAFFYFNQLFYCCVIGTASKKHLFHSKFKKTFLCKYAEARRPFFFFLKCASYLNYGNPTFLV